MNQPVPGCASHIARAVLPATAITFPPCLFKTARVLLRPLQSISHSFLFFFLAAPPSSSRRPFPLSSCRYSACSYPGCRPTERVIENFHPSSIKFRKSHRDDLLVAGFAGRRRRRRTRLTDYLLTYALPASARCPTATARVWESCTPSSIPVLSLTLLRFSTTYTPSHM